MRFRRITSILASVAMGLTAFAWASPAHATGASTISGVAFQDLNRDTVFDTGDVALSGRAIYLYLPNGSFVTWTTTDANGRYTFGGLSDATYQVEFDPDNWPSQATDWVPTTSGPSLSPNRTISLSGSATVDFGIRQIKRSTDLSAPLTRFVAGDGLTIESFDDVYTAAQLNDMLRRGTLVGPEAGVTTIRFDYGTSSYTVMSIQGSTGSFSNYQATVWLSWNSWLQIGDGVLFHEYGHAWSGYFDYLVQQEGTFASYLQQRGILDDPRLDTSHAWDRHELIAEDYRQLFGSSTASAVPQENTDLPPASQVAGLKEWMSTTFLTPPSGGTGSSSTTTTSTSTATTAFTITNTGVSPQPVSRTGTISWTQSDTAAMTVRILDASGSLVKTLVNGQSVATGTQSVTWDRTNSKGQRVKTGSYTASVSGTTPDGRTASATVAFSVK